MNCEELLGYLSDYIDENLADDLKEAIRNHIACCPNCKIVLDSTMQTILLYKHGGGAAIPISRRASLYKRLEQALNEAQKCE